MKKENISYVFAANSLQQTLSSLAHTIRKTQEFFQPYGGFEQYKSCTEKGYDYQRQEVLASCRAWLADSKAPEYMYQTALENAYNSLGEELNAWIDRASGYLPISYMISGNSHTLAPTDIEVTQEGEWKMSQRVVDEITAHYTRTLTDEEMKDLKLAEDVAELYAKLCNLGYSIDTARWTSYSSTELRAEALIQSYDPLKDSRVSDDEKEKMRNKMNSFYAQFRI